MDKSFPLTKSFQLDGLGLLGFPTYVNLNSVTSITPCKAAPLASGEILIAYKVVPNFRNPVFNIPETYVICDKRYQPNVLESSSIEDLFSVSVEYDLWRDLPNNTVIVQPVDGSEGELPHSEEPPVLPKSSRTGGFVK